MVGVLGTSVSNEKESRAIKFAVTAGESREAFLRRYSTLEFILPFAFAWPFCPLVEEAEPLSSGSFDFARRDLVPIEFPS